MRIDSACFVNNSLDSVVMGWPIADDSGNRLWMPCWNIASYQLSMTINRLFVRGGIDVSEAYFDDCIQSGNALFQACELESHRAKYPRIVLSKNALKAAESSYGLHGSTDAPPLCDLFLVDYDGEVFINYLASLLRRFDPAHERERIVEHVRRHRDAVESCLKESSDDDYRFRRYQWAADYHDTFCDHYGSVLHEDLKISVDY